jgi:hypothetical protein
MSRQDWGIAVACGVVAVAATCATFGGLQTPPGWHDEAAYLLQAKLFASGAWAAPSPRLPEFFEQFHVLVVPVLAAKYPPGQSFFLTAGVAVGLPGLMVVLAAGATAALIYCLVLARWSRTAALGAVLLWVLSPMALYWRSSYMSEVACGTLWLAGLMLALRWWKRADFSVSLTLGVVVGAMAITRPVTALAFAIPLGAACAYRAIAGHRMRDGITAVTTTLVVLMILPIWARQTTGSASEPPVSLYTAQYMPWDRMGFGLDAAAPTRQGPPDMASWAVTFRTLHSQYTPSEAVRAVANRAAFVGRDAFGRWWAVFGLLVIIGCFALGTGGILVAAQAGALFLLYGFYAHFVTWDVYYFELVAPACGCAAVGLAYLIRALGKRRAWRPAWNTGFLLGSFAVLGALLLPDLPATMVQSLRRHDRQRQFLASVTRVQRPAIVYAKYGTTHNVDAQFVGLLGAPGEIWIAHDRGARNVCLAAEAPQRHTYQFDEDAGRMRPIRLRTDPASLSAAGCP